MSGSGKRGRPSVITYNDKVTFAQAAKTQIGQFVTSKQLSELRKNMGLVSQKWILDKNYRTKKGLYDMNLVLESLKAIAAVAPAQKPVTV